MKQIFNWLYQHWLAVAVVGFGLARVFVFLHLPGYVRYFEEYANIWYYGMPPYLQHWFEYPPATIPFISLPLYLDQWGLGFYRVNFRLMMLLIDALVFAILILTVKKMPYSRFTKLANLIFYLVVTVKAKDFLYENLDLLFVLSMFLPVVAPLIWQRGQSWMIWLAYWFGIGIKLVNAPLGALYGLREISSTKKWRAWLGKATIPLISFILIWAWPLFLYRSALSVVIVYHQHRTLQAESLAALVVRAINIFTHTETIYLSNFKSYDLQGPISDQMLPLSVISLILLMLVWLVWVVKNWQQTNNPVFLMKATLVFIFSYLATNKVFSTQYHLWYLPLIAAYPYVSQKQRWLVFGLVAIFLGVATTRIPQLAIGPTDLATLIPVLTQIPIGIALVIISYSLPVLSLKHQNLKVKK